MHFTCRQTNLQANRKESSEVPVGELGTDISKYMYTNWPSMFVESALYVKLRQPSMKLEVS